MITKLVIFFVNYFILVMNIENTYKSSIEKKFKIDNIYNNNSSTLISTQVERLAPFTPIEGKEKINLEILQNDEVS